MNLLTKVIKESKSKMKVVNKHLFVKRVFLRGKVNEYATKIVRWKLVK